MKLLLVALLITMPFLGIASTESLKINQSYQSDYYLIAFPLHHQGPVENYMNDLLEPYQCTRGRLTYDILKEFESSWFGKDKPGTMEWTFKAKCFESTLKSLRFAFEPAGYDEDYSQLIVELKTAKTSVQKRVCLYATRTVYLECYKELPRLKNLSVPGKR